MKRALMLAALAMLFDGGGQAKAGPVLEFAGFLTGEGTSQASFGWSFTTNQAISVVALDAFDPTGGTQVRLYNSLGTTLAFATVTLSDPTEGSPVPFYTHAITPVALAANTTYYVAQDIQAVNIVAFQTTSPTTDPAITYGGEVSVDGLGQNPTTDIFSGQANPGLFGPNFDISATPEPGTLTLIAIGIAGMAGYGWRKRKLAIA